MLDGDYPARKGPISRVSERIDLPPKSDGFGAVNP